MESFCERTQDGPQDGIPAESWVSGKTVYLWSHFKVSLELSEGTEMP